MSRGSIQRRGKHNWRIRFEDGVDAAGHRKRQKSGRCDGRPLSARTVGYAHRVLHRALQRAVEGLVLIRNVASTKAPPKIDDDEVDILDSKQITLVIDKLHEHRLYEIGRGLDHRHAAGGIATPCGSLMLTWMGPPYASSDRLRKPGTASGSRRRRPNRAGAPSRCRPTPSPRCGSAAGSCSRCEWRWASVSPTTTRYCLPSRTARRPRRIA